MHLDLHQIRSHELIREADAYRPTRQVSKAKSATPRRPAHGDRLDHACWLGSAGEPSRCPPWCGTPTTNLSHSTAGSADQSLTLPTAIWGRTTLLPAGRGRRNGPAVVLDPQHWPGPQRSRGRVKAGAMSPTEVSKETS